MFLGDSFSFAPKNGFTVVLLPRHQNFSKRARRPWQARRCSAAKRAGDAPRPPPTAVQHAGPPCSASQPAPSRHSTGGAASERPSCVSQDRFCKTENQPFFFTRHAPSAAGLRRAPAFCQAFCKYPLCKQHRYLLYLNTHANTIRNPGVPRQAPYKFSQKLCLICSETLEKIHIAECMTKNCR